MNVISQTQNVEAHFHIYFLVLFMFIFSQYFRVTFLPIIIIKIPIYGYENPTLQTQCTQSHSRRDHQPLDHFYIHLQL